MTTSLRRRARAMTTALAVTASFVTAGALAWAVRRHEARQLPAPTACEGAFDAVFADAASTPDSVLLARLLDHRDRCMGDAAYVDQARRLMLNLGRTDDARALLADAGRRGALAPDEQTAQAAWVDLADAQLAWGAGDEPRAAELHARATAAADALRRRWPEWSLPYRILDEAGRAPWVTDQDAQSAGDVLRERAAQRGVLNGAFVRGFTEAQAVAFAFVVALAATLALWAGARGLAAVRALTGLPVSPVAGAPAGYGAFAGTLHLPPGAAPVIGTHTKTPGLWYQIERRSGSKGARTYYDRSAQPFVLRDASGEAVVEPRGLTVRTRHVATRFRPAGPASGGRVTERMLLEGDTVYVQGELGERAGADGAAGRRLRVAADGRRLLVSTLPRERLLAVERTWLWAGTAAFVVAAAALAWAYYQRYHVTAIPGTLR
jgi:hypothetical protein